MAHHKNMLASWLKDAHAMEQALIPILENHAKDAKGHPQMQARVEQHIEETRRHAGEVERCLERLGEGTSTVKSSIGTMFGNVQSISTGAAKDELVKNALADFAAEHFEIASYKSLIAAAEDLGDSEIASVCRTILQDEESMARFLDQQIPMATREIMQREAERST